MFNRTISTKFFAQDARYKEFLTADVRRFSQIGIRTFHRRDAEYAEEIPFAQSGDDDWAKTYGSNLRNVFVCCRLPTNKNLILWASAVSFVSLPSCTSRPSWSNRLSPRRARRSRSLDHCSCQERKGHKDCFALSAFSVVKFSLRPILAIPSTSLRTCFASLRESSFSRFRNPRFNGKFQISLPRASLEC